MSDRLLEIAAVVFYICVGLFSLYYGYLAITFEPKPACGVAEISPDIDTKQKEQCRQIRGHKL
jgi:hypothetical protein